MMIRKMNTDDCREVLARVSIGRLGCSLNNQPHVVPVGLAYEANDTYVFSTFGQKIKWMRENPKVCIQIDEIAHDLPQFKENDTLGPSLPAGQKKVECDDLG